MTADEEIPVMPGWITVSLAAEELQVSRQTVHQMVQSHRLTGFRVPSAAPDDPVIVNEDEVTALKALKLNEVVDVTP